MGGTEAAGGLRVHEVRPGLWSLPVPIPAVPLGYVLCYAFEVTGGVVLVDPGWNASESLRALEAGLGVLGARLADVPGGLGTHIHPDHHRPAGGGRGGAGGWAPGAPTPAGWWSPTSPPTTTDSAGGCGRRRVRGSRSTPPTRR